ncbi:3-oxoacyl-ACP synthase III family protein [Sediminitomix flava]|uniref:3-oxoacyl-[acyl-carrier-protein] synthase-3 n=1 Tax=Sediminitomix flava TaxID=379075 RepID=A0A315ZJ65_SEDFL|nr:ketoacyl-ACP synthase III [Sediminitomix flava]PWJ44734.1 3-oxoacyl-[acyl-carrier-protein] synthase-3 [Sediminitomix flava]
MRNAKIVSSGMYVPEQVYSNQYFNDLLQQDVDEWLRENVQIYERRWCAPEQSVIDLCREAALTALHNGNVKAEELDLIIIATDTPEYISPSTASKLQDQLGAKNAGTFDLNSACAGFVTSLDIASKYIRSDEQYNKVLVIGAYAMSKYLNKEDKKTVTLFADGAAAFILSASEGEEGFLASELQTKGEYADWMGIYAGATHEPTSAEVLEKGTHQLQFVKRFPSELNPEMWTQMALNLCEKLNVSPNQVDHFFFTQININSIVETMNRLGVPMEKTTTVMHNYGYTGSACIPMAFDEAVRNQKVKKGDLVFFIGSGGGLSFGSAAFRL